MNQHTLITPNQGIWRSVRNGVLVGLIGGLVSGLIGGPIGGLIVGPHGFGGPIGGLANGLVIGLVFGSIFGPFFGLLGGWDAFIQHFALRWFLWRAGFLPWKYPRFLDYAVACILLRKVGGGYIFIHRLLLEYFAVPDTASPSDEAEN